MILIIALLLLWAAPPLPAQNLENGKKVYEASCAQCHGVNGTPFPKPKEGAEPEEDFSAPPKLKPLDVEAAPAAPFVFPRPRDFTRGLFKIRSTPSGALPSDADLERVIAEGMPGSSMPAWKESLSGAEIRDVAAYLKTFSDRFASEKPLPPIDLSGAVRSSKDSIAKGEQLFKENGCNLCHGEAGRGDGPSAPTLRDDWGNPIRPANFHQPWTLRGGSTRRDLFRTLMTGLNGTPMPSFLDAVGDTPEGREKGWHIANYLAALGEGRPNYQEVLRAGYRRKLPETLEDPAWEDVLPVDFPLVGQIIAEPRQFMPSVERVAARAFYDAQELALLLEWDDRLQDAGDALEVQWPLRFNPEPGQTTLSKKPYLLRGDAQNPVELWRWQSGGRFSAWRSVGPKSKPQALKSESAFTLRSAYNNGVHRLLVRRKLTVGEKEGLSFPIGAFVPVVFSAWDGANGDAGLKCSVSAWYYLLLEPRQPAASYAMPALAFFAALGLQFWFIKRRGRRS